MLDAPQYLCFYPVMASLRAFLNGLAPILGMTGATLYERQRVLTTLGVLEAAPGRGPGSGVPLTADGVAAVIISLLATDALSEVDQRVVALCNAVFVPDHRPWHHHKGNPTFKAELGRALSGQPLASFKSDPDKEYVNGIRVSRVWRGQITLGRSSILNFIPAPIRTRGGLTAAHSGPISLTAEIEDETLSRLIDFTRGALSQLEDEEEE
jgi:hypothetical protein